MANQNVSSQGALENQSGKAAVLPIAAVRPIAKEYIYVNDINSQAVVGTLLPQKGPSQVAAGLGLPGAGRRDFLD